MNANITEDGVLVITAETSVEAYALNAWLSARKRGKSSIEVKVKHPGYKDGIAELSELMKLEAESFRQWKREQAAAKSASQSPSEEK